VKEKIERTPSGGPPEIIDSAVVLSWAKVDRSIRFTGRLHLYVAGQRLGKVPRIAIARDRTGSILVLFCNRRWRSLGATDRATSLSQTKKFVAQWYEGIDSRWVDTGLTARQARKLLKDYWAPFACSFCGQVDYQAIVIATAARICNRCVESFHASLTQNASSP